MSFSIDTSTSWGLGRHNVDIPQAWIPSMLASQYAFAILYCLALISTKSSVLVLYLSISETEKFLRVGAAVTLIVVNVAGFALMFLIAFQCRPVRAAYDLSIKNPSCIPIISIFLASAAINIITNLSIIVLPISVIARMRLPRREKAMLIFLFTVGIVVTVINVVRIYYLQLAASRTSAPGGVNVASSPGFSYNISLGLLWAAVEVNVGITCTCLPTLKPLAKTVAPQVLLDYYHRTSNDESQFNS